MSLATYSLNSSTLSDVPVATITMDDGKANVISPAMVDQLNGALDKAEQERAVVIITGRRGMFSGGYDLSVMEDSPQAMVALVQSGSELARRLLDFPRPVIAVSSGHAIAMGAFLLLSSDYRFGLEGAFKYGLNEVAIGMTMHHVGIELARGRLTRPYFNRAVMNAELFRSDTAVVAGFLDQIVLPEDLDQSVQHQADLMATLNRDAFRNTKRKARRDFLDKIDWAIAQDMEDFNLLMASREKTKHL